MTDPNRFDRSRSGSHLEVFSLSVDDPAGIKLMLLTENRFHSPDRRETAPGAAKTMNKKIPPTAMG